MLPCFELCGRCSSRPENMTGRTWGTGSYCRKGGGSVRRGGRERRRRVGRDGCGRRFSTRERAAAGASAGAHEAVSRRPRRRAAPRGAPRRPCQADDGSGRSGRGGVEEAPQALNFVRVCAATAALFRVGASTDRPRGRHAWRKRQIDVRKRMVCDGWVGWASLRTANASAPCARHRTASPTSAAVSTWGLLFLLGMLRMKSVFGARRPEPVARCAGQDPQIGRNTGLHP